MSYRTAKSCRSCRGEFLPVIDLGNQYLANFDGDRGDATPLELVVCADCDLLQLHHTADQDALYRTYWYESGINSTIRSDLSQIAAAARNVLAYGDMIVDIGCNDGTLLELMGSRTGNYRCYGFDPSNIAEKAEGKGATIIRDFFSAGPLPLEKARVITAISMFYDLDRPNLFLEDIKYLLHLKGVFIVQQNYLVNMLANNAFDNICHEHLEYYTLRSLIPLLDRHELEVFKVEYSSVNGGSIRTYIGHEGVHKVDKSVYEALRYEEELGLHTQAPYIAFADTIAGLKRETMHLLRAEREAGRTTHLLGASTRGNTILQYYGIGPDLVPCASERNPSKWGRRIMSVDIPIISEGESRGMKPDNYFVLPWFFKDEIVEREVDFLLNGGKLIFPLPNLEVVAF